MTPTADSPPPLTRVLPARSIDAPGRYASVDALRGVVMFVMLYVNDVAGVRHIPWWMKHYDETGTNGMTFVDWVFGGFLFIVGVSIPLAFAGRIARGEAKSKLLLHILTRTIGLLILGVLMVNEDADPAHTGWPAGLWTMLVFALGILAFLAPVGRSPRAKWITAALRVIGFAGLAYLALVFRNEKGQRLQTEWWGILGLIGWAYLTASVLYLALRGDRAWLAASVALLVGLFMFDHSGFFDKKWAAGHLPWLHAIHDYLNFGECLGSHAAITMAGVVLGVMLLDPTRDTRQKIAGAIGWGALLLVGAVFTYPAYGISKNNATPAWGLICAAATCWLWAALAVPIDWAGMHRPLRFFIRGGQNVLLAYMIAPLWEIFCDVANIRWWGHMGRSPGMGITRALLLAAVVLWMAGFLKDRGVRLKL